MYIFIEIKLFTVTRKFYFNDLVYCSRSRIMGRNFISTFTRLFILRLLKSNDSFLHEKQKFNSRRLAKSVQLYPLKMPPIFVRDIQPLQHSCSKISFPLDNNDG